MNEILKIIEERDLYAHLILTKIYLETKGQTNDVFRGDYNYGLESLFEDEFNEEMVLIARNYLYSEGYVEYPSAVNLTIFGRRYFENLIKSYQNINEEEVELLKTKLPDKVVTFLGLTSNVVTILDFINKFRFIQ
jgi:hypothetical protein